MKTKIETLLSVEKIPGGEVYRIAIRKDYHPDDLRHFIDRNPTDTIEVLTDDPRIAKIITDAIYKSIALFTEAMADNN